MKYPLPTTTIPQEKRATINQKIVTMISSGETGNITRQDIFQAYTGDGGLHELNREDYSSYYTYAEAKKEIENGQFFTPAALCGEIVACLPLKPGHSIGDLSFGSGNFFNFLPNERNIYGCEIDVKAFRVASYLYPDANLYHGDIRYYKAPVQLDVILGNPPFNIRWNFENQEYFSQFVFLKQCYNNLRPAGLLAVIVPEKFLNDEFTDGGFIEQVNEWFSFLGQCKLPLNAFDYIGVKSFPCKVMFLQKIAEGMEAMTYQPKTFVAFNPEFINESLIKPAFAIKEVLDKKITLTINQEASQLWSFKNSSLRQGLGFEFRIKKYLYESRSHKSLSHIRSMIVSLSQQLINQQKPEKMKFEEWENVKLTEERVLKKIQLAIKQSYTKRRTGLAIYADKYGIRVKANDSVVGKKLNEENIVRDLEWYKIVNTPDIFLKHPFIGLMKPFKRKVSRVLKHSAIQTKDFNDVKLDALCAKFFKTFTFTKETGPGHRLNEIQRSDLGKMSVKPFGALSWEQGGGKTVAAYALFKFRQKIGVVNHLIIIGPPISIRNTWQDFLILQGASYVTIDSLSALESASTDKIWLIPTTRVRDFKKRLKSRLKPLRKRSQLVFDESDEITSPSSVRTKAILACFRRFNQILLTTGTTTRNNIAELYSQLELLYNNSFNLVDRCMYAYEEVNTKDDGKRIREYLNKKQGTPFKAFGGVSHFKACFSPSKSSVFGIQKLNQDVYNLDQIRKIIGYSIISRKFKEIAGEGKYELTTHLINQSSGEMTLYKLIIAELSTIIPAYYSSTGNSRKDAMLRIIRQLQLLIKACSIPHLMDTTLGQATKVKKITDMVSTMDERVLIGVTTVRAAKHYVAHLKREFPKREILLITGQHSLKKQRKAILREFSMARDGVLVATQQSLSSSLNIPYCQKVIIESMQWNLPRISQFYFRCIRFDSPKKADVHFVIYDKTIEVNLLSLLAEKERINDFIKTKQVRSLTEVLEDFDVEAGFLDNLLSKKRDDDGKVVVNWGNQKLVA